MKTLQCSEQNVNNRAQPSLAFADPTSVHIGVTTGPDAVLAGSSNRARLLIKRHQKRINGTSFTTRWCTDPRGSDQLPLIQATDRGICDRDLYISHNNENRLVKMWVRLSQETPKWEAATEGMRHPHLRDYFLLLQTNLKPSWVKRGTIQKYNRRWITAPNCFRETIMLEP